MNVTPHVLVIDADASSREKARSLLVACGAPVEALASNEAATAWLLEGNRACAVVLACEADSQTSASALVSMLRFSAATVDVPVIVLSSVDQLKPFDDRTTVLMRPFSDEALLHMVSAAAARCATTPAGYEA